jgi:hypothetical protein
VGDITFMGSDVFRRFRRPSFSMCGSANRVLRRCDYLIVGALRATQEPIRMMIDRLEWAFANFAKVQYHDARARQQLEQMLDDLEDESGAFEVLHQPDFDPRQF